MWYDAAFSAKYKKGGFDDVSFSQNFFDSNVYVHDCALCSGYKVGTGDGR